MAVFSPSHLQKPPCLFSLYFLATLCFMFKTTSISLFYACFLCLFTIPLLNLIFQSSCHPISLATRIKVVPSVNFSRQ